MVGERPAILVVGCGSIGQRHARLLAERADVAVWVCDAVDANLQAAVAAAPGTRPYADYTAALADQPAAVFVCTPNHLHRPMSIAALEAGCHVFCEKPLAESVESAREIAAAAAASDRIFQVGYVLRQYPGIKRIVTMVQDGEMGTLIGGRALVGTYFTLMCAQTPYRLREKNVLVVDYTHQPDYLRLIFGQAVRVSAESATLGKLEMMPEPNVFSLMIRYASGALVQIHLDYVQHPQQHILEVFGDRRSVALDFTSGELRVYDREREGYQAVQYAFARDDLFRTQIEDFLAAVRGEGAVPVNARDGVAALQVAEAAIASAETGQAVAVS